MSKVLTQIPQSDLDQLRWRLSLYERMNQSMRESLLSGYKDSFIDLNSLVGSLNGKRVFMVGNGPSLNKIDMKKLKTEVTFGSNRVYLGFEQWGFPFTYWSAQDETQIIQSASDYVDSLPDSTIKFIPEIFLHLFPLDKLKNCCPVPLQLHPVPYPQFSDKPSVQFNGWTVSYLLIQIAIIMGSKEIILVGLDHSYNLSESDLVSQNRWRDESSKNHFHKDYAAPTKDHIWNVPRFDYMDVAFDCAAKWAKENGVAIRNATPGTKLESFEKIAFDSLF